MKRAVLLAVLVLGVGAPEAGAAVRPGATTIMVEDGSPDWPYQRWVNRSPMATPSGPVRLNEAPCPGLSAETWGCLAGGVPPVIYLAPAADRARWVLMHELGHVVDIYRLADSDRTAIADALKISPWSALHGGLDKAPPQIEVFANRYASCAMPIGGSPNRWRWAEDRGRFIKARGLKESCRLIAALMD